jgi:hypothetical protein
MSHIPTDHPLRPTYRVIGGLTGVWLLVFGALGLSATRGGDWFGQGDWTAMGLPTNRAFAAISVVAGLIVLGAAVVGRNVDRSVNLWGGIGFLVAGTVMMALSHTALNVLNFSVVTSIASYVIGFVLLTAGLYGKVGRQAPHPEPGTGAEPALPAAARE